MKERRGNNTISSGVAKAKFFSTKLLALDYIWGQEKKMNLSKLVSLVVGPTKAIYYYPVIKIK